MKKQKKLNIVQVTSLEERVPPHKYGGTELVVSNLTEELVRRGHKVTLFASNDSLTSARLVAPFKKPIRMIDAANAKIRDTYKIIGVAELFKYLLKNQKSIDIIHNHTWRIIPFLSSLNARVVNTVHHPLDIDYQLPIYKKYSEFNYISISNNQQKNGKRLKFLATVYNGINVGKFKFNSNPEEYLAFLGRMSLEKGLFEAIKTAKIAGCKLKIAAKIDIADEEYYKKIIKPEIDNKQIQYMSEVNQKGKTELLKNALVCICPLQWNEPFGLMMVEAMACGTPVIAFKRGSVPEVVKHNKTGFIVPPFNKNRKPNIEGLVEAVKKIDQIDRRECRRHVEENFTVEKMVDGYEEVYRKILKLQATVK